MIGTRKFGLAFLTLAALAGVSVTALGTGAFDRLRNFVYVGDTATITAPSNGSLDLQAGNAGFVGIGTSAPSTFLQVNGAPGSFGRIAQIMDTTASVTVDSFGGIYIGSGPGTDFTVGKHSLSNGVSSTGTQLEIRAGATPDLVLNSSTGNVGIGSTSPGFKLDVGGTLHASGASTLSGGGALTGTFTGSPTFSGSPSFSNSPSLTTPNIGSGNFTGTSAFAGTVNFSNTSTVNANNVLNVAALTTSVSTTLNGATTINASGGNVPHACTRRTSTNAASSAIQACSAGEIVLGGGCVANAALWQSSPGTDTQWNCATNGIATSVSVWAVCCTL